MKAPSLQAVQIGISPKVWIPALGQVAAGGLFLAVGLDVEGKTAIATGLGTFVAGWSASPGAVLPASPPAHSDSKLSAEAQRQMENQ